MTVLVTGYYTNFSQQFSDEELAEMHGGHWQNPAYQNMEQLMDERYALQHQCLLYFFVIPEHYYGCSFLLRYTKGVHAPPCQFLVCCRPQLHNNVTLYALFIYPRGIR